MTPRLLRLTLGALLVASPALAGGMVQHSGPIVATNLERNTITIAELGPWHGPSTRPVEHEIRLPAGTQVALAERSDGPGGFRGAFAEEPTRVAELRPGDYATVTEHVAGGHLVPTKIVVVRPGARSR